MIRLVKLSNSVGRTYLAAKCAIYRALLSSGAEIPDSLARAYADKPVKDDLIQEVKGKCAYCESKVTHIYWGDVEHILPKTARPDLALDYDNLGFACAKCNNAKRDYYDPALPLVNPYCDDPAQFFTAVGPLMYAAPGNNRAKITRSRLKLDRAELVERRRERIDKIMMLLDEEARHGVDVLKDVIQEQIREELGHDKEFAFTLRGVVRACAPHIVI